MQGLKHASTLARLYFGKPGLPLVGGKNGSVLASPFLWIPLLDPALGWKRGRATEEAGIVKEGVSGSCGSKGAETDTWPWAHLLGLSCLPLPGSCTSMFTCVCNHVAQAPHCISLEFIHYMKPSLTSHEWDFLDKLGIGSNWVHWVITSSGLALDLSTCNLLRAYLGCEYLF